MSNIGFPPVTPGDSAPLAGIIGSSPAMQEAYRITKRVARSEASVLLLGETGTGKELFATAIHQLSQRVGGPFVKVNCGALSDSLLESELFGHVRGAFTGAVGNRTGRFEAAHTGSIFLDEINSTSLLLQVKLLRVLQEREFERVGDTQTINVDCRVIAASNRDLWHEVQSERFREDLYWRLNVVPIPIPPLRQRREDIPQLVAYFLRYYCQANDRYVVHIERQALEAMQEYHWPGNVRELQNYVERAVVMAEGDELTADLLPHHLLATGSTHPHPPETQAGPGIEGLTCQLVAAGIREAGEESLSLQQDVVGRVERELILQTLVACGYVQTKAASRLGINRNTLHKKLKEYGLEGLPPT
jgi:transcriptional regulator with GAF, ATPase, and Fis domain